MDLPDTWGRVRLGNVAESKLGKMLDRTKHTVGVQLKYLRNINVRWGNFELSDLQEMFFEEDEFDRYGLLPGDVLVCEGGEPGRAAVWDGRTPAMKFQKALHRVRPGSLLLPKWLELHLRYDASNGTLDEHFTGTTIKHLTGAALAEYEIALPPFAEQKRIVAKVEELTARSRRAKQALDAVPPLLDQLRQSILAAAFRGAFSDQNEGRLRDHAERMTKVREQHETLNAGRRERRKDPPADWDGLPALPAGWTWERADDVVEPGTVITYGIVLPGTHVEAGVPYIRGQDIENGQILVPQLLRTTPEISQKHGRSTLQKGDVLLCIIRHLKVAVVPAGLDGANITQGTVRLRPSAAILSRFIAYYLSSTPAQNWMKGRYFGLAMPRINVEDAREIPVPVPPIEEQKKIVATIDALDRHLEKVTVLVESAMADHSRLSQAFLAKAFRGELVPQDPEDEPASTLLDRIRASHEMAEARLPDKRRPSRAGVVAAEVKASVEERDRMARTRATIAPPSESGTAMDLSGFDAEFILDEVFTALWTHGPLEKDAAVRRVAEHLRVAGHVDFQRLRADGPLYAQILDAIELAVKAGHLDRPKRGHVRACKTDATAYTPDDWRHALVASLGTTPSDRDDAIRAAAEWARDNLGLAFARLREDGPIVQGLRSAINSAIRRGEVARLDATRIVKA